MVSGQPTSAASSDSGRTRALAASAVSTTRNPAMLGSVVDQRVVVLRQLRPHQVAIRAVHRDQLGVAAALHHRAVLQHQDAVGADHAGQPVRQDQRGAPGHQPVERLLDHRLVLGIDRRQRLVQHQDRRVAQQRPGDRDALALAAGKLRAALADHRRRSRRAAP